MVWWKIKEETQRNVFKWWNFATLLAWRHVGLNLKGSRETCCCSWLGMRWMPSLLSSLQQPSEVDHQIMPQKLEMIGSCAFPKGREQTHHGFGLTACISSAQFSPVAQSCLLRDCQFNHGCYCSRAQTLWWTSVVSLSILGMTEGCQPAFLLFLSASVYHSFSLLFYGFIWNVFCGGCSLISAVTALYCIFCLLLIWKLLVYITYTLPNSSIGVSFWTLSSRWTS